MKEYDFVRHYLANAPQLMWMLGAGASRSAGMPTATDIIWDLKVRYYCLTENQELQTHDISNDTVKKKVQNFCDSKGFPPLWSDEEYSFYFALTFGTDYSSQQRYLNAILSPDRIALNNGHKILAALLATNNARMIFTTNFDGVVEDAFSSVAQRNLSTFHLEGAYATLDSLNQEQFPMYVKLHGDFRYQSVKNLSQDLLANDLQLQRAFLASGNRFGMVVTGYSGRDNNVMKMFNDILSLPNPFPQGLFWTTPSSDVSNKVIELINRAQSLGVNAHIVEVGTFEILMSKIWRQLQNKPPEITKRVDSHRPRYTPIQMPQQGKLYPLIRTNVLPIVAIPNTCAEVTLDTTITYKELKDLLKKNKSRAIFTKSDKLFAWGEENDIRKAVGDEKVVSIQQHSFDKPTDLVIEQTHIKAFYERALAVGICDRRPLNLRTNKGRYILAVDPRFENDPLFDGLKQILKDYNGNPGMITGSLSSKINWSEAVEVNIETADNRLWLSITPTIWIDPKEQRKNQIDFVKRKVLKRWNRISFGLVSEWIKLLFNPKENGETISVELFAGSQYAPKFYINTRTAYSKL